MPDMLVKLYTLPDLEPVIARQRAAGVEIRRALPPEKHVVVEWVRREFGDTWASETDVSFARQPVGCFIAVQGQQMLGFACYEATCKDYFGPTGVSEAARGRGIGAALLLAALHALRAEGYAYAIIGAVGPAEFYSKVVGATLIADSTPGILGGMLRAE
ncbi:MAG: GNAT family N-acetyltransferase [Aggregatilineales bacterium]